MAGGLFARAKVWIFGEDLDAQDLDNEFDNIISNLNPQGISGFEASIPQMRSQQDPGGVGTENLGVSIADDEAQLRFAISRIIGGTYWYETPAASLNTLNSLIAGTGVPKNRIVSGAQDANNQPQFLKANGAAPTLKVLGTSVNFVQYVNNTLTTLAVDTTSATLTTAPTSNNTATLNGLIDINQSTIAIQSAGSAITALVGTYASFLIDSEYVFGFVKSSTSLERCIRGGMFNSSNVVIPAAGHANGATVTLMKTAWVFLSASNAIAVTYNNPTYSMTAPSSPASGDYWFSFPLGQWQTYNGSAFVAANANLIGIAIINATNCIATRSFDFFKTWSAVKALAWEKYSNTELRSGLLGFNVSVNGAVFSGATGGALSAVSTSLFDGTTIGISTRYYIYITDGGLPGFSSVSPVDRRWDFLGWYHPNKPYRCVGQVMTDSSGNFLDPSNFVDGPIGTVAQSDTGTTGTQNTSPQIMAFVNILCNGSPVILSLVPNGVSGATSRYFFSYVSGSKYHNIALLKNGVQIGRYRLNNNGTIEGIPPTVLGIDLTPIPGEQNYAVVAWVEDAANTLFLDNLQLVAFQGGSIV